MEIEITVALIALISSIGAVIYNAFSAAKLKKLEMSQLKAEREEVSRSSKYEVIWALTNSTNLFGPSPGPIKKRKLSGALTNWYFENGMYLEGTESKKRYFLVQEILSFAIVHDISFKRPEEILLHGQESRTMEVLSDLRMKYHGIKTMPEVETQEVVSLARHSQKWKSGTLKGRHDPEEKLNEAEINWILLQFVFSKFRGGLKKDLGI